jgi:high-affinity iron transporter
MKSTCILLLHVLPWWLTAMFLTVNLCGVAMALPAVDEKAQTVVHMLDYIRVDYPEFVQDGKVVNVEEHAEQREFASQAVSLLGNLPAVPE